MRKKSKILTRTGELQAYQSGLGQLKKMEVLGRDDWRYQHLELGLSFLKEDIEKHGVRQLITEERSKKLLAIVARAKRKKGI